MIWQHAVRDASPLIRFLLFFFLIVNVFKAVGAFEVIF